MKIFPTIKARPVALGLSVILVWSTACASFPEPIEAPILITDNVELFRRTRFQELAELEGAESKNWISLLRQRRALSPEHLDVLDLRQAYELGDVSQMTKSLKRISSHRPAYRLFSAILENIDTEAEIRHLNRDSNQMVIALDREYLQQGLPVIEVIIFGRIFKFLWDTGSTENIMSYEVARELDLVLTHVHFPVLRDHDGYVVRLAAAHTTQIRLNAWRWTNVPWLISDLRVMNRKMKSMTSEVDGVLSPQLLLPSSCFVIDRQRAVLELVVDRDVCRDLGKEAEVSTTIYDWNGEIYASVQILDSPRVGARFETGSAVSFLRHDAVRYLPQGAIADSIVQDKGEITRILDKSVAIHFSGRHSELMAIELQGSRLTTGHDDVATLGADIILRETDRLWVDFSTMSMGFLKPHQETIPLWDPDPGSPKFSLKQTH